MSTEAQKKAQKKYDLENKEKYRQFQLKLNRTEDADIIAKLDDVDNKQGYIKDLIRNDIK